MASDSGSPAPRRWLRRTLFVAATIAVVGTVSASLLPTWLSTDSGRAWLLERVSASIPGEFSAAGLELNWSGGQKLESLSLADSNGNTVARVRLLAADISLAQIVRGDFGSGRIVIEGLEIDLVLDDEGRLNLASAVAAPDAEEKEPIDLPKLLREFVLELPPSLTADIQLKDARVSLRGPAIPEALELTDVSGTLRLARVGAPIEFDLGGVWQDGTRTRLTATLEGFDDEGRLRASNATLVLTLDGEIAGSDTLLRRVLGSKVHWGATVKTMESGAAFDVVADSSQLMLKVSGGIELTENGRGHLRLTQGTSARYVLTPAALQALGEEDSGVTLAGDVGVSLALESLELPLDGSTIALDAQLEIDDGRVAVRVADLEESLAWTGWSASIRKPADGEEGMLKLQGRIDEGEVDVSGKLRLPAYGNLRARISELPLARIDRVLKALTGRRGVLVDALGPTLNLTGDFHKEEAGSARLDLRIDTERLQLHAPLEADFETDTLSGRDVTIEYTLARSLVPDLESDVSIKLDVPFFSGALTGFDPERTAVRGKLEVGGARLRGKVPHVIESIHAEVRSQSLTRGLKISADYRIDGGRMRVEGDLAGLWDRKGRFQLAKVRGKLEAAIDEIPMAPVAAELGGPLSGSVTLKGDGSDAKLNVRLTSANLDLALPISISGGRARLARPGRMTYRLTPKTAARFGSIKLRRAVEIDLALSGIDAPADVMPALEDIRAAGTLSLGPVLLADVPEAGDVTLMAWKVEFDGESLANPRVAVSGNVTSSRILLGGPLLVDAKGGRNEVELTLEASDRLALTVAVVRDGDEIRLREPARLDFSLRRDFLKQLELPDEWLAGPLPLKVQVDKLRIPLSGDWKKANASFRASVATAQLRVEGREVALRDLTLRGEAADRLVADLSGKLGDGTIAVHAEAAQRNTDGLLRLDATVRDFPTALLGQEAKHYVGATADVTVSANLDGGLHTGLGFANVTIRSPHLVAGLSLQGPEPWVLREPATMRWTLTPESFETLLPDSELRLAAPAVLKVDVTTLTAAAFEASARVAEVRLAGARDAVLAIRGLALDIKAADLRKPINISLDGSLDRGGKPGRIHGKVVLTYLGAEDEPVAFAEDRIDVRVNLDIDDLPVASVDALFALDGYLPAVLGASASGKWRARINRGQGPIDIVLRSGNLQATVAGQLTRRSLLLRRPVTAKLINSKALADKVLPKLGPFFQGIVATGEPIRVEIRAKGFRVPREFDFAKVVVPHAMLDIGQVTMENQTLVKVIKQLTRSGVADKTTAWFTPVEVSLRGGVVRYTKRLDLLLDQRYHFSTWGKADLVRERVDMTLGIMPSTLREILRIRGAGSNDTLRIRMTGPLEKPRVDAARAAADLAAVRGKYDALRNLPRLARPFAEAALNQLLKKTFQGPPPLPATVDPLPWLKKDDPRPPR